MAVVQCIQHAPTWWRHDQPQTGWLEAAIPTFDPALLAALAHLRSGTALVLPPPRPWRDPISLQPQPIFGALEMQADPALLVPIWHLRQAHWLHRPRTKPPDLQPQLGWLAEAQMGVHHFTVALTLDDADVQILLGRNLLGASQAWLDAAAHAATLADESGGYSPILLVEFLDVGRTFATASVPFLTNEEFDLARLANGGVGPVNIDLQELFDIPRLGNSSVRLLNAINLAYTFDASPLANTRVRFKLGLAGLAEAEYLPIFTGVVDRYTVSNEYLDLAIIDSSVQENVDLAVPIGPPHFPAAPEASRSLQVPIFVGVHTNAPTIQVASDAAAEGTLGEDFTDTDIRLLVRETDENFPDAGTVMVDSETLDYTLQSLVSVNAQTYLSLSGLTRAAPVLHVAGTIVTLQNPEPAYLIGWGVQRLNAVRYDGDVLGLGEFSVATQKINGKDVVLVLPDFVVDPAKAITVDINAAAPTIALDHAPTETPGPAAEVPPANLLTNPGFETGDATGYTTANGGVVTVGTGVSGGGNLVTNGGFESGTTGWTTSGASLAVGTASPAPYEGTQRAALTGGQDTLGDTYRDITVAPNMLHEFRLRYQNAIQPATIVNGNFAANVETNTIPSWTITTQTDAVITPGDFRYTPAMHLTGLPPGASYEQVVLVYPVSTSAPSSAGPWYATFEVAFYQDVPTVVGVTYRFLFTYVTIDDLFHRLATTGHRTTNIAYRLGTPTNNSLYQSLVSMGQSILVLDGLYDQGRSTAPLTSSPAVTFAAQETTTRISFVMQGVSPIYLEPTNSLNPLMAVLGDVYLDSIGGLDQSQAAYRLGTPANPVLYADTSLPVAAAWRGEARRFVPTSSTVRVTLRSQYRLHSLASYFDAVSIEQVTTQMATPAEGMYRAALTGGLTAYGDLAQEVATVPGTSYAYSVQYQTQKQGSLVTNGSFTDGLTGWTILTNTNARVTTGPAFLAGLIVAPIIGPPYVESVSVEIYQDVPTTVGEAYVLRFFHTAAYESIFLQFLQGSRQADVGYKLGTPADDDAYVPLTLVSPVYRFHNGYPQIWIPGPGPSPNSGGWTQETPKYPYQPSPQITFTALTTTTRISFVLTSVRNLVGIVLTNPFAARQIAIHSVDLQLGTKTDESTAAFQLGPPATPGLYRDETLAVSPGLWTIASGTFTASDTLTRLTLRSQYSLTPMAAYFDALSVLAQPQAAMGPAGPPVALSSDTGENPIDVLLFLFQMFNPNVGIHVQAFQEARDLLAAWKFTGIVTAPGDFNSLVQRLAQQCKSLLIKDERGNYTMTVLDSQRPTVFNFTPTNILRSSMSRSSSPVDSLYSSINVYFNTQKGGSTSPADYAGVAFANPTSTSVIEGDALIALCAAARTRLDRDHLYNFFADFVHDLATANLLLAWLVGRFTVEQTTAQFTSWLDAVAVRPGQVVRVEHRTLPQGGAAILGEVIGWHYQAGDWTHELVVRSLGLSPDVVEISPDAPVANDDVATTSLNMAVTLDVPFNDIPALGAILDLTSVDLDPTTPGQQVVYVVAGRGVFVVNAEGIVTFTPETNIPGETQITYAIKDNWGNVSNAANITVNVGNPGVLIADDATVAIELSLSGGGGENPTAEDFTRSDDFNIPSWTIDLVTGDFAISGGGSGTYGPLVTPAAGETLDLASVDLDPATAGQQTTLDIYIDHPEEGPNTFFGTLTVDSGAVLTFTHEINLDGLALVPYTIKDTDGRVSNTATMTIIMVAH